MTEGAASAHETAGFTDIGPVRKENQDAWGALPSPDGGWALLLADGMGGHAGGREAATAALEAAAQVLLGDDPASRLQAAVSAANQAVGEVAIEIGGAPGTTLVLAVINGEEATIANIGDSRAYLIASGSASPVTEDHSWVGEQVRLGRLTPEEIRRHPRRNMITRAVMGEAVTPDVFTVQLGAGATLLLCSDGVWEPLDDSRIAELLSGDGPLDAQVEQLCRAALDAGGTDNVTAVAVRSAATA